MLSFGKRLLRTAALKFGYDIVRVVEPRPTPRVAIKFTDLSRYRRITEPIPGMISSEAAELLYGICVTQDVEGDVMEIGSWQGKSTSYLARAVRDSGNGHMFAVDHFRGNIGKEGLYSVGDGLENLQAQFEDNMKAIGLQHVITTLPYFSEQAYEHLDNCVLRLLFIDGDHSESGVRKDIQLYCPLVRAGGIVVFDDFDITFPGLVSAVVEWVEHQDPRSVFVRGNMLVCKL